LTESDLDAARGAVLVRHGKNDRRREVGMDAWGWSAIEPWLADRLELPVGALFCVIDGPTRGRAWSASAARVELRKLALNAGVRRRFVPHHYADPIVMPRRARSRCSGAFGRVSCRHTQRFSRNFDRASGGR